MPRPRTFDRFAASIRSEGAWDDGFPQCGEKAPACSKGLEFSAKTGIIRRRKNTEGKTEFEKVTDNAPLRAGKAWAYEGGCRIPFLVMGPGIEAGSDSYRLADARRRRKTDKKKED